MASKIKQPLHRKPATHLASQQVAGQVKKLARMKTRPTASREAGTLAILLGRLPADHDSAGRGHSAGEVRTVLHSLTKPHRRMVRKYLAALNRRDLAAVR